MEVILMQIFMTLNKKKISHTNWLVGWFVGCSLWHINICTLFNAKSILIKIISFISNNSL